MYLTCTSPFFTSFFMQKGRLFWNLFVYGAVLFFLGACCKEPEPDIPCDDFIGFSCKVNGEPFKTQGNLGCPGFTRWYNPNIKQLVIDGANCNARANEPAWVNFTLFDFDGPGEYSLPRVKSNYTYRSEIDLIKYDSIISTKVYVTGFVEDNYSADFTNGYVEGTFEFIQYNDQLKDTAYITNGRFCMRF